MKLLFLWKRRQRPLVKQVGGKRPTCFFVCIRYKLYIIKVNRDAPNSLPQNQGANNMFELFLNILAYLTDALPIIAYLKSKSTGFEIFFEKDRKMKMLLLKIQIFSLEATTLILLYNVIKFIDEIF